MSEGRERGGDERLNHDAAGWRFVRVVTFVLSADPRGSQPRLGVLLPGGDGDAGVAGGGEWMLDLQAAHMVMTQRIHPLLVDAEAFAAAGPQAVDLARRVVEYARSQRPPGTMVPAARVREATPVEAEG